MATCGVQAQHAIAGMSDQMSHEAREAVDSGWAAAWDGCQRSTVRRKVGAKSFFPMKLRAVFWDNAGVLRWATRKAHAANLRGAPQLRGALCAPKQSAPDTPGKLKSQSGYSDVKCRVVLTARDKQKYFVHHWVLGAVATEAGVAAGV